MRNRGSWIQYVRRFSLTIGIAVFCFIVFPAAPPWMIAEKGYLSSVSRITGRGWWELHLKTVSKTLDRGAAVLNPVAAMPSLHAGLSLLAALWFARNARRWVRIVVLLYPVAMLTALVYFGEHFIIDGLMGWLVVLIAWRASAWWEQRPTQKSQLSN
jgi:membrane-associated phospholipid phosphatase